MILTEQRDNGLSFETLMRHSLFLSKLGVKNGWVVTVSKEKRKNTILNRANAQCLLFWPGIAVLYVTIKSPRMWAHFYLVCQAYCMCQLRTWSLDSFDIKSTPFDPDRWSGNAKVLLLLLLYEVTWGVAAFRIGGLGQLHCLNHSVLMI